MYLADADMAVKKLTIKGVVHCVRAAGHICTQKSPR